MRDKVFDVRDKAHMLGIMSAIISANGLAPDQAITKAELILSKVEVKMDLELKIERDKEKAEDEDRRAQSNRGLPHQE